jgi:hypothetical protein
VAKQARRLLDAAGIKSPGTTRGEVRFYTSGDPDELKSLLPKLLGESGDVERVEWLDDLRISRPQSH